MVIASHIVTVLFSVASCIVAGSGLIWCKWASPSITHDLFSLWTFRGTFNFPGKLVVFAPIIEEKVPLYHPENPSMQCICRDPISSTKLRMAMFLWVEVMSRTFTKFWECDDGFQGHCIHHQENPIKNKKLCISDLKTVPGWWFQPLWKILVKLDHSPR